MCLKFSTFRTPNRRETPPPFWSQARDFQRDPERGRKQWHELSLRPTRSAKLGRVNACERGSKMSSPLSEAATILPSSLSQRSNTLLRGVPGGNSVNRMVRARLSRLSGPISAGISARTMPKSVANHRFPDRLSTIVLILPLRFDRGIGCSNRKIENRSRDRSYRLRQDVLVPTQIRCLLSDKRTVLCPVQARTDHSRHDRNAWLNSHHMSPAHRTLQSRRSPPCPE